MYLIQIIFDPQKNNKMLAKKQTEKMYWTEINK